MNAFIESFWGHIIYDDDYIFVWQMHVIKSKGCVDSLNNLDDARHVAFVLECHNLNFMMTSNSKASLIR